MSWVDHKTLQWQPKESNSSLYHTLDRNVTLGKNIRDMNSGFIQRLPISHVLGLVGCCNRFIIYRRGMPFLRYTIQIQITFIHLTHILTWALKYQPWRSSPLSMHQKLKYIVVSRNLQSLINYASIIEQWCRLWKSTLDSSVFHNWILIFRFIDSKLLNLTIIFPSINHKSSIFLSTPVKD